MITLGVTDPNNRPLVRKTLYNVFTSSNGDYVKQWLTDQEKLTPLSIALFEAANAPKGSPQYEKLSAWLTQTEQYLSDPKAALERDVAPLVQYVEALRKIQSGTFSENDYGLVLFQGSWTQQGKHAV